MNADLTLHATDPDTGERVTIPATDVDAYTLGQPVIANEDLPADPDDEDGES